MALLLYVPVLHEGYLKLFARRKKERTLYILGEQLINEFPLLAREIRRVDPEVIAQLVRSLKIFETVIVATPNTFKALKKDIIVSANEVEMHELVGRYLPSKKVQYDTAFLRWDSKSIHKKQLITPTLEISSKVFDRKVITTAAKEAKKSADWFRQVGAVLVKNKRILLSSFNERQPTPQAAYSEGDPRNFVSLGVDTHLRLTLHAEQSIITQAAKRGIPTEGASLYVTTFPCPDCAALIAACGITACYFSEGYAQLDGQKILKLAGVKIIKVK